MASPEVTITANLEGVNQVAAGFNQIGEAAGAMGSKVGTSTDQMDVSYRRLALTSAGLIANSIQLGDIMQRMATGQMDVGRGALMLAMNFLQLASQIWVVVGAEHARAIAHGIANALEGPVGWAILAGAVGAAIVGTALAASIPSRQFGGSITQTGPYMLHAGEYVVPHGASPITINVYGAGSPRETGDAVVDALRRAGVVC
jgi:hypothetical protein